MEIRRTEPSPIPFAESTYKDWRGTSCAENSLVNTSSDLYELAGLDHERWTILAIDIDAYSHGEPPNWDIRVYAADHRALGVGRFEDWQRAADDHGGSIPVVDVLLHDLEFEDIIRCMKIIGIQLRLGSFDIPLTRTAYADHPEQG